MVCRRVSFFLFILASSFSNTFQAKALLEELLHVLTRAAENAPAPHLRALARGQGNGHGIVVDVQPEVEHNFQMSAFLSWFELTTNHCGSALRLTPARNPRSGEADTFAFLIASHSD